MKVKATSIGGSVGVIIPYDICRMLGIIAGTDLEMDLQQDDQQKFLVLWKCGKESVPEHGLSQGKGGKEMTL